MLFIIIIYFIYGFQQSETTRWYFASFLELFSYFRISIANSMHFNTFHIL